MAEQPTTEELLADGARTLRALEKKILDAHRSKLKWKPTGFERIGPLYLLADDSPVCRTAYWGLDDNNTPIYIGESIPDELIAGIQQLAKLQAQFLDVSIELRARRAQMARHLTKHGMTHRQAGAALEVSHARVCQLVKGEAL